VDNHGIKQRLREALVQKIYWFFVFVGGLWGGCAGSQTAPLGTLDEFLGSPTFVAKDAISDFRYIGPSFSPFEASYHSIQPLKIESDQACLARLRELYPFIQLKETFRGVGPGDSDSFALNDFPYIEVTLVWHTRTGEALLTAGPLYGENPSFYGSQDAQKSVGKYLHRFSRFFESAVLNHVGLLSSIGPGMDLRQNKGKQEL
jgi:hypothetical protein